MSIILYKQARVDQVFITWIVFQDDWWLFKIKYEGHTIHRERKRRKSFNSPSLLMWNMKVLTNWFVFLSSSLLHICQKLKSFPCFSKIKFIQRTGGKEDSSNIVSKIAFTIVYKKEDDISKPRTVSQWFYQQTTEDIQFFSGGKLLAWKKIKIPECWNIQIRPIVSVSVSVSTHSEYNY